MSCQGFVVLDLASIVRRRTLASTAVGGDCHLAAGATAIVGFIATTSGGTAAGITVSCV